MALKTIKIYGHWAAPNPFKVLIVLEALGLPYEHENVEFHDVKNEYYTKINPNGRLPAMEDPNTGLTLWESGAILQYLVDEYDKDDKISFSTMPEKYLTQQWVAFQISGQGPYTGQAVWFARFHPQKHQDVIDRYFAEALRIIGVIETGLQRNASGWLVGNKCSYADLAFVTWAKLCDGLLNQFEKKDGFEEKFPLYNAWIKRLNERPEVKTIVAVMQKGRADHGMPP